MRLKMARVCAGHFVALHVLVYAQHGRELMGLESPVCEPVYAVSIGEVLDQGNCGTSVAKAMEVERVTDRGEEA